MRKPRKAMEKGTHNINSPFIIRQFNSKRVKTDVGKKFKESVKIIMILNSGLPLIRKINSTTES